MMDIIHSTLIQECMEKNEARVFKNAFPNIFSTEEFNNLLNLRAFQTVERLQPTKEVRKLTKWKRLSEEDRREPWVKNANTIPNEKINELAFDLEEMSGENCDAHIFFSVKEGLENHWGAHYDDATNLIVQAVGKTHWRCCKDQVDIDVVPTNVKNIEDYGLYIDEVLEPGDAIFIPKSVIHEPKNLTSRISVSFPMKSRENWLERKNQRQDRKWLNIDFI